MFDTTQLRRFDHAQGPRLVGPDDGYALQLPGVGVRFMAWTEETGGGWTAHPMKVLAPAAEQLIGVLRREGERLWLQGVEKKERREYAVSDAGDAEAGDLVLAEKAGRPPRITARVVQRLGDPFAPRSFSLIAIHRLGIPDVFAQEALDEAQRVARQPLGEGREDLTHLPITHYFQSEEDRIERDELRGFLRELIEQAGDDDQPATLRLQAEMLSMALDDFEQTLDEHWSARPARFGKARRGGSGEGRS